MDTKTGAVRISTVTAMSSLATPFLTAIHLPHWHFPRPFGMAQRRRRATVDLIHASPHLLRDIGVSEGHVVERGK